MNTNELLDSLDELRVGVRLPVRMDPTSPSYSLWAAGVISAQQAYSKLFKSEVLRMHTELEAEKEDVIDLGQYNTITEATDVEMHRVQVRVAPGNTEDSFETLFAGHPDDVAQFTEVFNAHMEARE